MCLRTLFLLACFAVCGMASQDSRWWSLYTPEELKKVISEHEAYLVPDPNAKDRAQNVGYFPRVSKAMELFTYEKSANGHKPLYKAYLVYKKQYEMEANARRKMKLDLARLWAIRAIEDSHFMVWDKKLVADLPDEYMDGFFWLWKRDPQSKMLGEFGPRASRFYEDVRKHGIESGKIDETKTLLERIKKN